MKNTYKIALVLLSISVLVACFCKKEKCPKLSDEIKTILPHYNGEVRNFKGINFENNKIDTLNVTIYKKEVNKNISCSAPEEIAGNCDSYVRFQFLFNTSPINYGQRFEPYLRFGEDKNEIKSSFRYSKQLQDPYMVNGKYYLNVIVDSIETPNNLSDPRETVLYYSKKEGLLIARSYLNETLTFEASKIN